MTAIHQSAEQQLAHHEWEAEAQRNFAWTEAHREELTQYVGQWIAVANEQLIAHDANGAVAMWQARERGFMQALWLFLYPDHVAFA